jgi:hypothetical protein
LRWGIVGVVAVIAVGIVHRRSATGLLVRDLSTESTSEVIFTRSIVPMHRVQPC